MTIPHVAEVAIFPVAAAAAGALVALTFTPSDIATLTLAAAAFATALLGGIAVILTAIRSTRKVTVAKVDEVVDKIADNTKLTKSVEAKVGEVAVKVDGQATRADEQIASMQKELQWLRERIGEQKQEAALLAQAKTAPPISATNIQNGSDEHLTKISENTEEIKHNTAKDRR